jgi:hypothetical protein
VISASDMLSLTKSLTVTDSSVEGLIKGIPAGKARLFQVFVYDSLEVMQYKGSATADVIADSTVKVSINLVRIGGNAIINGTVIDSIVDTSSLTSGLLAYYPFNGNTNDASGNGFNATNSSATLTTDRFGNPNKAYFFNGNGGMLATVNSLLSVSKFTIAAWIKSNGNVAYAGVPRIASIAPAGECNGYYELLYANGQWSGSVDNSKRFICYLDDPRSSYDYYLYYSKKPTDTATWHHGAITFDNGNLSFYVDGALDTTIRNLPAITQFSGSASLQIGYCPAGGNFNGKLDDIRIYNRALSDIEIQKLFTISN